MNELIYEYTRAQAIDDGNLIDVSEMAEEVGIKYPVSLTWAVWSKYVEVPEEVKGEQDKQGRLWDILMMFRMAARRSDGGQWLRFQLVVKNEAGEPPKPVTLNAHCGPGDTLDPVITIMLPGED